MIGFTIFLIGKVIELWVPNLVLDNAVWWVGVIVFGSAFLYHVCFEVPFRMVVKLRREMSEQQTRLNDRDARLNAADELAHFAAFGKHVRHSFAMKKMSAASEVDFWCSIVISYLKEHGGQVAIAKFEREHHHLSDKQPAMWSGSGTPEERGLYYAIECRLINIDAMIEELSKQ